MHQLSIFDQGDARPGQPPPRARRDDPRTSQLAAAAAAKFASSHAGRIYEALAQPGTIKELAQRTGLDHVAVARRMPDLQRAELADPTDAVRDGCRVWARRK